MDVSATITLIKDIALGGAAISGVVIAWRGFNIWQRQQTWQVQYQTFLKLIKVIYQIRKIIKRARKRLHINELIDALEKEQNRTPEPNDELNANGKIVTILDQFDHVGPARLFAISGCPGQKIGVLSQDSIVK